MTDATTMNAVQWREHIIAAIRDGDGSTAIEILNNPPECLADFDKIGVTHIVLPSPDHVTEEMLDAPRGVLLYTDVMGPHDAGRIREMISYNRHYRPHIPVWFNEYEGHLTKAARLQLIYSLIVAGYKDPEPERERPTMEFPVTKIKHSKPQAWCLIVVDKAKEKQLNICQVYRNVAKSGDRYALDLQINRHQLPDDWRKFFKPQAIDMSIALDYVDGVYKVSKESIQIALKAGYRDGIEISFDDGSEAVDVK